MTDMGYTKQEMKGYSDMKMIQAGRNIHWYRLYKLYYEAFPAYERKPFSLIRSMQKKGKSDVWYFEKNGQFAGLVFTINSDELILIDYLAIVSNRRGEGIGSEIIAKLREHYAEKGIFVEIESVFDKCDNSDERLRRKHFYLNNGMVPMNVMIILFGVEMELLGIDCCLTYDEYYSFYKDNYGDFATKNIKPAVYPNEEIQYE